MVQYRATVEDVVKDGAHAEAKMAYDDPKYISELDGKLHQGNAKFQSKMLDQEQEQSWRS